MLWSIHSGLSEQEGSVSGPISLLCLLLRLTMWSSSRAHPHINNGHPSSLSIFPSWHSIFTRTLSSLQNLLGDVWGNTRWSFQLFVLLIFSLVNIDSLSLSSLSSLSVSGWRGVSDYQKWDGEKHDRWNENHVLTINPCFSVKTIEKCNISFPALPTALQPWQDPLFWAPTDG